VTAMSPREQVGAASAVVAGAGRIDISQIRYFLVAVEHLNYTRAALALGVSSSTLSRQIHRLEDNLGVSLFERHRNGIRLTAAGRRFHARAQQFMFELGRAIDSATRAGRAQVGDLNLGVAPSIVTGPLQRFLQLYRRLLPDVEIHCLEGEHASLILALREHRIDIAVGYPDLDGNAGVRATLLWHERLYVAVPDEHVFARDRFVRWEQFENQSSITRGWTVPPHAYKELARRLPRSMDVTHHLVSCETLLGLVAAGFGFAVVPASATVVAYPGVAFRPIKEPEAKVAVFAAWLDERDNPAKVKFVAELRAFADTGKRKQSNCCASPIGSSRA
jgi:DNA-binding transcriptional LysR family regulator